MKTVNCDQISRALHELGLGKGDGVLVHSAIQYLGQPEKGVAVYWEALREATRPEGTIAVPAFSFEFAGGKPYDPLSTPSVGMGSFTEYVRCLPGAVRTLHPMQSMAVIGKYARDIASRDTLSAFDAGSAFERLLDLDFWVVLLGADIYSVSLVHYSEQRATVPYRYWKEFSGQVLTRNGWQARTCRMFVRDLELNPRLDLSPVEQRLREKDEWRETPLNYGRIAIFRARAFIKATDELLEKDLWSLVVLPSQDNRNTDEQRDEVM